MAGFDTDDGTGHHVVAVFNAALVGDVVFVVDTADLGHQINEFAVVTEVGAVKTQRVNVVVGRTRIEVRVTDRVVKAHANEEVAAHGSVKADFNRVVVILDAAAVQTTVVVASPSTGSLRHGAQCAHTIGEVGELRTPDEAVHQSQIRGGGKEAVGGRRQDIAGVVENVAVTPLAFVNDHVIKTGVIVSKLDAVDEIIQRSLIVGQSVTDVAGVVDVDSALAGDRANFNEFRSIGYMVEEEGRG